jgi:anti-anti-sigma factor
MAPRLDDDLIGFDIKRTDPQAGCVELRLDGELDFATADRLARALDDADRAALVVVGFEGCSFIDSTGIALLVHAHREMAKRGRRLVFYGASGQVSRTLAVTGLTGRWPVFETRRDALAQGDAETSDSTGLPRV